MSRRFHAIIPLLALCFVLALVAPVESRQRSRLIVAGNVRGESSIGSLHPLRCSNPDCRRITDLLFPYLLHVDPASGTFAPATAESGLAESWEFEGNTVTYHLRDDRFWSDGAPITAYDVYYSYLFAASDDYFTPFRSAVNAAVESAAVIDANTIQFTSVEHNCTVQDMINIPIVPAHVFQSDFADVANAIDPEDMNFDSVSGHPMNTEPAVTAGEFEFHSRNYQEYIRLITPDGSLAFEYRDVQSPSVAVDMFLRGELNLLFDPPFERRGDLMALDNVQITEQPGSEWFYIALNLADNSEPASAFDEDGNPLEQGGHPLFSDPNVRRAMQLGIDVDALIQATAEGYGTQIASSQPPSSWVYNANLTPFDYDPVEAARLLDEAGWKDINRDGIRECFGCTTARPNTNLSFELLFVQDEPEVGYPDTPIASSTIMANIIRQQLTLLGFDVITTPIFIDNYTRFELLMGQYYEAVLMSGKEKFPVNPDQTDRFARASDVLREGGNISSYFNPDVDGLLEQARTNPTCDIDERRSAYEQIQATLQADQPYIWLFSPTHMIVSRDDATLSASQLAQR